VDSQEVLHAVVGHRPDGRVIADQAWLSRIALGLRGQATQILVAEELVLEGDARGMQQGLTGVGPGETEDPLEQPEGAHAAGVVSRFGPAAEIGSDALASGQEPVEESLLGRQ
jgi:hypothetical protein